MPIAVRQSPNAVKSSGVVGRIKKLVDTPCNLKICIYGRTGTGKTSLVGSFPKPMLLVRSPAEFKRKSVYVEGADVVDPQSIGELKELAAYQARGNKFKTVVLDNVTDFQDMALKEVLGVEETPAQLGWGVATQQQWGEVSLYMKDMMRDYVQKLDCHVAVLAQEREFNNDSSSDIIAPYVNAGLSPSIAGWLGPACDYLVQTFLLETPVYKEVEQAGKKIKMKDGNKTIIDFCLRLAPHPVYSTKFTVTRGTKVPEYLKNPSFTKIMDVIEGRVK